jgi:DNA ligase-1
MISNPGSPHMQAFEVIEQLTAATSRARREQIILDAYTVNCTEFFEAVRLAADPFISFGVKKVAEIIEDDGACGTLTFADFRRLCDQLRTQTLKGDAARILIRDAAQRCHARTWNGLYRRILLKDLRVVETSLINRVLKRLGPIATKLSVPIFRCQTATTSLSKPLSGQYLVDIKLSGMRLFAVLDKIVQFHDAHGVAELGQTYPILMQALQPLAAKLPSPIVLDGVFTKTGDYVVFDMIPYSDFRARASAKTQLQRRVMLELLQTAGVFSGTRVRVLPQIKINFATDEGKQAFAEFGQQAIEQGHHALMVKRLDAPYQGKQNRAWMCSEITIT